MGPISVLLGNKGNNKITELRTILQRESQNSIYKQTKSVNNRKTVKTVMILTWYRHFQRNGAVMQGFSTLEYEYSQNCIKDSPLGQRKNGFIKHVTS